MDDRPFLKHTAFSESSDDNIVERIFDGEIEAYAPKSDNKPLAIPRKTKVQEEAETRGFKDCPVDQANNPKQRGTKAIFDRFSAAYSDVLVPGSNPTLGNFKPCLDAVLLYRYPSNDIFQYVSAITDTTVNHEVRRHLLLKILPKLLLRRAIFAQSPPAPQHDTAPTPEQTDPEAFMRALQIAYKSDNEISVKVGTKTAKTYSFADIRFDREDTKAWQALIKILKSSDHLHHVGKAYGAGKKRNSTYDNNRAILREISKKIVSFLNETYTPHLPDKFQIFELKKNERPGTYWPKFGIPALSIDSNYNDLSKDILMANIEDLSSRKVILDNRGDEDSEKELSRITTELQEKIVLAINNKWLGKNRAASYLNPSTED